MLLFQGNLIMSSRLPEHGACYPGDIPVPRVPLPPRFCSSPSSHPSTGVPAQPSCQRSAKLRPSCPARQTALAGRRRRPAHLRPYMEWPLGHRLPPFPSPMRSQPGHSPALSPRHTSPPCSRRRRSSTGKSPHSTRPSNPELSLVDPRLPRPQHKDPDPSHLLLLLFLLLLHHHPVLYLP
jgi:hypothetical protein